MADLAVFPTCCNNYQGQGNFFITAARFFLERLDGNIFENSSIHITLFCSSISCLPPGMDWERGGSRGTDGVLTMCPSLEKTHRLIVQGRFGLTTWPGQGWLWLNPAIALCDEEVSG